MLVAVEFAMSRRVAEAVDLGSITTRASDAGIPNGPLTHTPCRFIANTVFVKTDVRVAEFLIGQIRLLVDTTSPSQSISPEVRLSCQRAMGAIRAAIDHSLSPGTPNRW